MMLQTALAAGAALVSLAFSFCTLERWLDRRRPHELAWTVALATFSAASAFLAAGAAGGWNEPVFRLFYLFGAIVNVPWLAVGTVYLLAGRRAGDRAAAGTALLSAFAASVLAVAPLTGPIDADHLPRGSEVFGPLPRVLAATASGVGALVVLGGALLSAWRLRRLAAAGRPGAARLVGGNLLIALGTLVTGASGLLNSVLGEMEAFAVTLAVGIAVLFAGFLVATSAPPSARLRPVSGRSVAVAAPLGATTATESVGRAGGRG